MVHNEKNRPENELEKDISLMYWFGYSESYPTMLLIQPPENHVSAQNNPFRRYLTMQYTPSSQLPTLFSTCTSL
jgi:hypothetical protein